MNSFNKGTLAERMGIEILEASPGKVVARMPVEGNTQPYGLLHGGASVVLAETVGSIAAAIAAGEGRAAMGLDISSTHHRGVRSGYVTATATALSEGRSVATYDIAIVDDDGRRVNTSRLTCVLRDAPTKAQ
nr:hotdog fold thioesterase [Barrientosiimonas endolithica]